MFGLIILLNSGTKKNIFSEKRTLLIYFLFGG